jgi:hypothetical protein
MTKIHEIHKIEIHKILSFEKAKLITKILLCS